MRPIWRRVYTLLLTVGVVTPTFLAISQYESLASLWRRLSILTSTGLRRMVVTPLGQYFVFTDVKGRGRFLVQCKEWEGTFVGVEANPYADSLLVARLHPAVRSRMVLSVSNFPLYLMGMILEISTNATPTTKMVMAAPTASTTGK